MPPEPQAPSRPLSCEVLQRKGGHRASDTLISAGKYIEELLEKGGIQKGHFRLFPLKPIKGSSRNKGIRITRIDEHNSLLIIIQEGSNDSAWEMRLQVPEPYAPDWVRLRLEDATRPQKKVEEVAPRMPAAPLSTVDRALAFVDDIESVALMIGDLFEFSDSKVTVTQLLSSIENTGSHGNEFSQKTLQELINRRYLRVSREGGIEQLSVSESELSRILTSLGLLRERPVLVPVAEVAVAQSEGEPQPTRTRTVADLIQARAQKEAPRRIKPVELTEVRSTGNAPRQTQRDTHSVSSSLADLEEKAGAFIEAQTRLRESQHAYAALAARRAKLDQQMEDLNASRAEALEIILDPEYSEAAAKLERITKAMDE